MVASRTTGDDRTLAVAAIAIGAVRVAIALAGGERFGGEATLATIMVVLGTASLARRSG